MEALSDPTFPAPPASDSSLYPGVRQGWGPPQGVVLRSSCPPLAPPHPKDLLLSLRGPSLPRLP